MPTHKDGLHIEEAGKDELANAWLCMLRRPLLRAEFRGQLRPRAYPGACRRAPGIPEKLLVAKNVVYEDVKPGDVSLDRGGQPPADQGEIELAFS